MDYEKRFTVGAHKAGPYKVDHSVFYERLYNEILCQRHHCRISSIRHCRSLEIIDIQCAHDRCSINFQSDLLVHPWFLLSISLYLALKAFLAV